jgi:hypothetical protein
MATYKCCSEWSWVCRGRVLMVLRVCEQRTRMPRPVVFLCPATDTEGAGGAGVHGADRDPAGRVAGSRAPQC